MNPLWWVLFTAINVPMLYVLGRWLFGDLAGVLDALKSLLMPDLVSMLRGQWHHDRDMTFRLIIWVGVAAGLYYSEYSFITG